MGEKEDRDFVEFSRMSGRRLFVRRDLVAAVSDMPLESGARSETCLHMVGSTGAFTVAEQIDDVMRRLEGK